MQHITCAICGKEFEAPDKRYRLYCCQECAKTAQSQNQKKRYYNNKVKQKNESIDEILKNAEKSNMSYGKYMMQLYMQSCRTIRGD